MKVKLHTTGKLTKPKRKIRQITTCVDEDLVYVHVLLEDNSIWSYNRCGWWSKLPTIADEEKEVKIWANLNMN